MRANRSYIIAGIAVLAIVCWFVFNSAARGDIDVYEAGTEPRVERAATLPTVVVETITARSHPTALRLYGRTAPNREVQLKAQTPGAIVSTPVAEGRSVRRGELVCAQDVDARAARVAQAQAQLDKARIDFDATTRLVEQGFRSPSQIAADQAALDAAQAGLKSAEIELDNVNLRAPFSGVFEQRLAEIGDYLVPGQACGLLVELNPLRVEAELTERQVGQVDVGQAVEVRLATGETVSGTVDYLQARADDATRTFAMEITIPNADGTLRAGVTSDVRVITGEALAHKVPAAVLNIADNGRVGVRHLDADDVVRVASVETVDEDADGIWVTGLPQTARVIVKGQDFVIAGTRVDPRSGLNDALSSSDGPRVASRSGSAPSSSE